MKVREVAKVVWGKATVDGAGVKLNRVFSRGDAHDFDPFLMLDSFGSNNYEDYILGFPMHPHRGIETITYLIEGEIDHRDSLGNSGRILSGQLQWMTSGSGILHEEMPQKTDKLEGLQFWLNMPANAKMEPPEYLSITEEMVREIPLENANIKLIAGEYGGVKSVVEPKHVKALMMDIEINPNSEFEISVPFDHKAFVYIFRGSAHFGSEVGEKISARNAVLFGEGDTIKIFADDEGVRLVLLSALPLGEPIAWGGPIVMNTKEELALVFEELDNGTFIK